MIASDSTPIGRRRTILTLGMPVVGAMISQNVLNLVDTAMVGSLGDAALAAVGTGAFAHFMAIAFIMGLSTGVQAMVARRRGEGREDFAAPLNGALALCLIAFPVSLALAALAPSLFPLLNPDPEVAAAGSPYLQVRVLGMAGVGMNFAFRGYWNAVQRPSLYLRTLLVMHGCNLFLNWVFIFGHLGAPALGAMGAGLGSAIATYVGTLTYILLAVRHAPGFARIRPRREELATLLRLSVPTGLQQLSFSGGFLVLFWILGQVGTRETAAANVVVNLMLVVILPGLAFGIAGASLVGQALGRGDPDDARRWGWDVVQVGVVTLVGLGLILLALEGPILGLFLHDPETLELARGPLRLFALTVGLDAVGLVLQSVLLGAGASGVVMRTSIATQWGLFLPAAYLLGPVLGLGLFAIWGAQVSYRIVQAGIYTVLWQGGGWTRIRV